VRDHVVRLGAKSYWAQFQPSPEFVVMFLPGETFFSAALQNDPTLIELGAEKRVIPASPITLIALLRAVAYGWRQEQLAENAERVSQLGRDLYERLCTLAGHFDSMRKSLDGAVRSYNDAIGSLESRVMVAARRFEELGVSSRNGAPELNAIHRAPRRAQQVDREGEAGDGYPDEPSGDADS
jgi:DNA recombination protein RmuC